MKTEAIEKMKPVSLYKTLKTVEKNLSLLIKEQEANCIIDIPKDLMVNAIPAYLDSIFSKPFY